MLGSNLSPVDHCISVSNYNQSKNLPSTWDSSYPLGDDSFYVSKIEAPYSYLHKELDLRRSLSKKRDVAKVLLKERIKGVWGAGVSSYPDLYASALGDEENFKKEILKDPNLTEEQRLKYRYDYELDKESICRKTTASMLGKETGSLYYIPVQCRKPWCPECGGWSGHIHLNRVEGVVSRVNLNNYQLQQLILTVPEKDRCNFLTAKKLNALFSEAKNLVSRFLGEAILDIHGHIKKYKLNVPAVAYLHLFGDPQKDARGKYLRDKDGKIQHDGKFHPHVNIHLFRAGHGVLQISKARLEIIKEYWLKCLAKLGCKNPTVNLRYSFITKSGKKYTAIKYMCKSWGRLEFDATTQDDVKQLLVLGLKSFKYIRFWGDMANSVYRDRMDMRVEKEKAENEVNEEMQLLGFGEVNLNAENIERIGRNLYRLKESEKLNLLEKKDEWKKGEIEKKAELKRYVSGIVYH